MGRLIDADALIGAIEDIKLYNVTPGQKPFDMNRVRADELIETIKAQPTAYDPEKVVAELDESSFLMEPRKEGHYADNGVFLDEAIKIVRKGGVE